jgi:hypothetical protein
MSRVSAMRIPRDMVDLHRSSRILHDVLVLHGLNLYGFRILRERVLDNGVLSCGDFLVERLVCFVCNNRQSFSNSGANPSGYDQSDDACSQEIAAAYRA